MEFLINFAIIWFSISILIIATGWYLTVTIPRRWPDWWRRVVVDADPYDIQTEQLDYIVFIPTDRRASSTDLTTQT